MPKILTFSKIKKENIFYSPFENLTKNNTINFSKKNIAILYGPNGTGKTSLSKVLNMEENTEFLANYNGYNKESLFHVINDQNSRNIIEGNPNEFFLGDNIAKEFKMKNDLEKSFTELMTELNTTVKDVYFISTKTNALLEEISDDKIKNYILNIVNKNDKGKSINKTSYINYIYSLKELSISPIDEKKWNYFLNNYGDKKSIIHKLKSLKAIKQEKKVREIKENTEAERILKEFSYHEDCIVCDTKKINRENLLAKKNKNRDNIVKSLDKDTKELIEKYLEGLNFNDPFNVKDKLINSIHNGNLNEIKTFLDEIESCVEIFNKKITNLLKTSLKKTELKKTNDNYLKLLTTKPKLEDEDIRYIEIVISENIGKTIKLDRDNNNNLKLLMDDIDFIGKDRKELFLSTGEQNFISLSFELLKAKNSTKHIIVLDDPISSFDSIYKNKIAFAIIKFLEKKKQIILSHNVELIRLLKHQASGCFNLYLFNNIENGENGFIPVNNNETEILLNIDKLLNLLRKDIILEIEDEKMFLMSIIPFMRAYANIIGNTSKYSSLSKLMHGYEKGRRNITHIYNSLLNKEKSINTKYLISINDILSIDLDNLKILKSDKYPLLNKALKHTLTYLYLRLKVEKILINKCSLTANNTPLLGDIIMESLKEDIDKKVFFTSRKTLLNEFNHFEGNMNIFQPAIDITDEALEREKNGILAILKEIEEK